MAMALDLSATFPPQVPEPDGPDEPKYGGYSRFEIELEARTPARREMLLDPN